MFRSLVTHLVVAVLGGCIALGGYVVYGHMTQLDVAVIESPVHKSPKAKEISPPVEIPEPAIQELKKTSRAFVAIAKAVQPAVVNINTVQVIKQTAGGGNPFQDPFGGSPFDDFFGDDFMRRFFGGPGGPGGQQPREQRQQGLGSGMIIDNKNGYILTNNHVVGDADEIKVTLADGRSFNAEVVGTDPHTDIGVIKIINPPADLTSVVLGDSDEIQVGDWAIAVGNPFGLTQTVTVGVISAKGRSNINVVDYENFIQTDAAINPGNSGGPLLSVNGEVIGVNTAIFSRSGGYQGIGFAIPSSMARVVMDKLVKGEKIERGFLGVYLQDLTDELAKNFKLPNTDGVLVSEVIADSPADKAGLKPGDVITTLNDKHLKDSHELRNRIGFSDVGTTAVLGVIRDGNKINIEVLLTARPADKVAETKKEKDAETSKFGISITNLTPELLQRYRTNAKNGVLVTSVDDSKIGAKIGLREGDVIIEFNRTPINNVEHFKSVTEKITKNDSLLFLVDRQGRRMFIALNR